MIEMSDADLLARLANFEDHFVERKTVADLNDSLKTVVAFANSAPNGAPCVLYIGVKNDGQFEAKAHDFDLVQKSLNRMLQKTCPRVPYFPKLITNGKAARWLSWFREAICAHISRAPPISAEDLRHLKRLQTSSIA